MSLVNELNYRKANALYKRQLKLSKKDALYRFTSDINPSSSPQKVWSNIKRFSGIKPKFPIHCITSPTNNQIRITNTTDIANIFCKHWSDTSCDHNFSTTFNQHKQSSLINSSIFQPSQSAILIEENINLIEFSFALSKCKHQELMDYLIL